jgi:hypothetical protein
MMMSLSNNSSLLVQILGTANVTRAVTHANELELMVGAYGARLSPSGSAVFNLMTIIDEAQNSHGDKQVARALRHVQSPRLLEIMRMKGGIDAPNTFSRKGLLDTMALVVETSATPEASLLARKSKTKPHMLQLPHHPNYYGYHSSVR